MVVSANNEKLVKIALFVGGRDWAPSNDLPKNCPHKFWLPNFDSRAALAEWFLTEGMTYYSGECDGIKYFCYEEDWYHEVAVIDLDISRPWRFHISDDPEWPWERIMYLDHIDADNRIYPEIYPPKD